MKPQGEKACSPHPIRVGIIGVGNCARSLIEGVEYSRYLGLQALGITRPTIGDYPVSAIDVCLAFDVDERKVGLDLAAASLVEPNCTKKVLEVPLLGVNVFAGPISDGLDGVLSSRIVPCAESKAVGWENIIATIRNANVDVLVNYLPVGALNSCRGYAFAAAQAGVAFVNCTPSAIATDREICEAFVASRTPLLGDDVKSHVGATLLHRILLEALALRNIRIDSTYQLNFGGNMDFFNMTDTERVGAKRTSKSAAISSLMPEKFPLTVGPSGYIEHLKDRKVCFLNIQATTFLDASLSIEMKLEVEDSPNSAAVVIDAIRVAKLAMDRGLHGPISEVCAALFKSPPHRMGEVESLNSFDSFVNHD